MAQSKPRIPNHLFVTRCYALYGKGRGVKYDIAACRDALIKWSDGGHRHMPGRNVADFFTPDGEYLGAKNGVEPLFRYGPVLAK